MLGALNTWVSKKDVSTVIDSDGGKSVQRLAGLQVLAASRLPSSCVLVEVEGE